MRKIILKSSIFMGIGIFLAGCNGNSNIEANIDKEGKLLSPAGAPTFSIYSKILDDSSSVTTTPTDIPVQLQNSKSEYDYIVFDSINALKFIKNGKSDYKFLGLLTSGNFHLVGFNKKEGDKPKKGDYIISFNQGLVTDEVLKYIEPSLYEEDNPEKIHYLNGVSSVAQQLKTGKDNNNDIDWALIAQPALYSVMNANNNDDNANNDIYDYINCTDKIKEITNNKFDFIPQAGLFVKNSYFNEKKINVEGFLTSTKENMNVMLSAPSVFLDAITKTGLNDSQLITKFGVNPKLAATVLQKDNANQIGIADPEGMINGKNPVNVEKINDFLIEIKSASANKI